MTLAELNEQKSFYVAKLKIGGKCFVVVVATAAAAIVPRMSSLKLLIVEAANW